MTSTTKSHYDWVWTECDNCSSDVKFYGAHEADKETTISSTQYVPVDKGWCLDFTGHYGGFTDDMSNDRGTQRVILCHDCALAISRVLPNVFKHPQAWHPCVKKESCCEFAWNSVNDEVLIGDGKGGWLPYA